MWLPVLPEVTPLLLVGRLSQQHLCLTATLLLSAWTKQAGQGPVELCALCSASSLQQKQVEDETCCCLLQAQSNGGGGISSWQTEQSKSLHEEGMDQAALLQWIIMEVEVQDNFFKHFSAFQWKYPSLTGVVHKQLVIWYQHGSSAVTVRPSWTETISAQPIWGALTL